MTLDLAAALAAGHDWPGLLGRFKTLALKPGPQAPMTAWYLEEKIYARSLREDAVFCQDSLPILELAPGESLDMRAAWDGKLNAGPAPAGPAVVEASFPFIGLKGEVADDDTDVEPISVRLDTSVVGQGGRPQLSPAVAIDAALEDPEFAAFVEAAPEDTWMGPDVTLIEGNWAVTLFRYRRGDQTVVLGETAIVDQTGRVVGHRSD
ncbi:MAG: hypothetical protein ACJ77B_12580 [Chloroflexota bacterium]